MSIIRKIFHSIHTHIAVYEHIIYPVLAVLFILLLIVLIGLLIKISQKNRTINHLILTNNANEELSEIENKISKYKIRFEAYLLRYDEIKTSIAVIRNSLNTDVDDWKDVEKIISLKNEISGQITKKEELEQALDILNDYASKVIVKLKTHDLELSDKLKSKSTLVEEIEKLNDQKQELVDAMEILNNYALRIISNIKLKDEELQELQISYLNLQAQYKALQARKNDLDREIN